MTGRARKKKKVKKMTERRRKAEYKAEQRRNRWGRKNVTVVEEGKGRKEKENAAYLTLILLGGGPGG